MLHPGPLPAGADDPSQHPGLPVGTRRAPVHGHEQERRDEADRLRVPGQQPCLHGLRLRDRPDGGHRIHRAVPPLPGIAIQGCASVRTLRRRGRPQHRDHEHRKLARHPAAVQQADRQHAQGALIYYFLTNNINKLVS